MATIQNAEGTYLPSGTLRKSLSISQRIIQPRQKSSSKMGTNIADERVRSNMKPMLDFKFGGSVVTAAPVREFSKSQKWRYPNRTSGATQMTKTATPPATPATG